MQTDPLKWRSVPGSFDALKTERLFASDNEWGIPTVPSVPLSAIPDWLAPYRTRIRAKGGLLGGAAHFFLDDYRFESVWNTPQKALNALREWQTVCSPDFSLYHNHPRAIQLWNVYRNRWCHAYWVQHGLNVIPTVSWGAAESYPFAFAGLPQRSVVAIGTVGTRWRVERESQLFKEGWDAMLKAIHPVHVLVYGTLPEDLQATVAVRCYPTYWAGFNQLKGEADGR